MINDCLHHRLIRTYEANAERLAPDQVILEILELVAVA